MQRDATLHPQAPALAAPAVPASSQSCHCHGALCCGIRGSLSGPADHPGHILPEGRHMFGSRVGGKPGRPCSRWAGGQAQRPCPASLLRRPPACHTPPPALTVSPDCPGPRGCGSPGAGCGCYGGACVGRRDVSGWVPTAPAGAGGGQRLERDGGGRSTDGWPQRSGPRSPATQRLARLRKSHAPGLGRPQAAQV